MVTEPMAFWEERMLKVIIGRMRHADMLHHLSGALVGWNSEGDVLLKFEMPKAVITRCARGFGSITEAPVIVRESPSKSSSRQSRSRRRVVLSIQKG